MNNFKQNFSRKNSLGFHFTLILFGMIAFGVLSSRVLLLLGFVNFVARDSLAIVVSYGFFFVLVRLWLSHVAVVSTGDLMEVDLRSGAEEPLEEIEKNKKWHWLNFIPFDLGEGTILLLGLILVLAGIFWLAFEGPVILVEAAFEIALSASFLRAASRKSGRWYEGVVRRTIVVFLLVWILGTAGLALIDKTCPGRSRLSSVAKECWFKQ